MKKWLLRILYAGLVMLPVGAIADYTATQGSGSTVFAFVCFTTKICPAHVLTNSAGTEIATSGNPVRTDPTGTTTQPVSATALPLPTGASTSANQSSQITQETATASATGTTADTAYSGTGSGTVVSILKWLGGLLGTLHTDLGTLNTTAGAAATLASQYPSGAVPLTASATGTTAATTATLAGTSGKTTFVCGYSIRANATANANVTNTLTGVISGTMSSAMWVPANTAGLGVDEQIFTPCLPASATNTGIAAVSGAPGTGGVVTSKIWGYQL